MAKLYTEAELRQALEVGIGLGQGHEHVASPAGTPLERQISEAISLFGSEHGVERPNFEHFRGLMERREYREIAHSHLAAGEMLDGSEAIRHAALGQLAATLELCGEIRDAAATVRDAVARP